MPLAWRYPRGVDDILILSRPSYRPALAEGRSRTMAADPGLGAGGLGQMQKVSHMYVRIAASLNSVPVR